MHIRRRLLGSLATCRRRSEVENDMLPVARPTQRMLPLSRSAPAPVACSRGRPYVYLCSCFFLYHYTYTSTTLMHPHPYARPSCPFPSYVGRPPRAPRALACVPLPHSDPSCALARHSARARRGPCAANQCPNGRMARRTADGPR